MNKSEIDKLELGCGDRPTPGYLHQDICMQHGHPLDFTCNPWEIPLEPDSLSQVLAVGVIEHLRFEEVHKTLAHVRLLLKAGGEFFFDVPDMKVWSEYLFNLTHGQSKKNPFTDEHIWSTIYGWQRWPGDEHKSGWTRASITDSILKAGFDVIEEGTDHFINLGINRRRFHRPADAHIFLKTTKGGGQK